MRKSLTRRAGGRDLNHSGGSAWTVRLTALPGEHPPIIARRTSALILIKPAKLTRDEARRIATNSPSCRSCCATGKFDCKPISNVDAEGIWSDSFNPMALIRTILVVLIALSVVALPVSREAVVSSAPVEVILTDQADMRCCPCCSTQDHSTPVCALKCMALAGAVLPGMGIGLPYLPDRSPPVFADDVLHEFLRTPPTRPPLV